MMYNAVYRPFSYPFLLTVAQTLKNVSEKRLMLMPWSKNVDYKFFIYDIANRELRDYANKRIPLPAKKLSEKDEDLLKKVSFLAQAVKVDPPPLVAPDVLFLLN